MGLHTEFDFSPPTGVTGLNLAPADSHGVLVQMCTWVQKNYGAGVKITPDLVAELRHHLERAVADLEARMEMTFPTLVVQIGVPRGLDDETDPDPSDRRLYIGWSRKPQAREERRS